MAIVLSITVSLVIGVTIMFHTKYFWGKEDNPNIYNINNTMTNLTGSFGTGTSLLVIIIIVVVAFIAMGYCTRLGF